METKKVSSASLENKTHDFLLMGLVVALGFLYITFEWSTTEVKKYDPVIETNWGDVDVMLPVTIQKPLTPPAPAVAAPPRVHVPNIVITEKTDVPDVEIAPVDPGIEETFAPVVAEPETVDGEDIIHVRAEVQPSFPGGSAAMMKFLKDNIKYPAICSDYGIQGRVVVSFVVNKDGSIEQVEVVNGVHERLDAEAIRVVEMMPAWTPGMMQGHAVRTKFILPVLFRMASK